MNELERRIEECTRILLASAREASLQLSGDRRVSEVDAAKLLAIHPGSLKSMRGDGSGPTAVRAPVNGSRWSYRIDDLAAWIEVRRINGIEQHRMESGGVDFAARGS